MARVLELQSQPLQCVLRAAFPMVVCVCVDAALSACPLSFPHCVHTPILYVCISVPEGQVVDEVAKGIAASWHQEPSVCNT